MSNKIRILITADMPKGFPFETSPDEEVFAVGDVHGCLFQFRKALEAIAAIPRAEGRSRTLVLLGDLIDRGPDSLGCVDLAMAAKSVSKVDKVVPIVGNHEQFVLIGVGFSPASKPVSAFDARTLTADECRRVEALDLWRQNGGRAVLGARNIAEVESVFGPRRIAWLRGLEKAYVSGSLLFIHAGMPPWMTLEEALDEPLDVDFQHVKDDRHYAWVREPFLWATPGAQGHDGRFVVHGHTMPSPIEGTLVEQIGSARVNLDGGSSVTGAVRFGRFAGRKLTVYESTRGD
jgi:serine/threonine protein phosphatase 1